MLVTLPNPYLGALARPSTFEVLRAKERTPTPHSFIMFTLDSHLSLSRSLGVHQLWQDLILECTQEFVELVFLFYNNFGNT